MTDEDVELLAADEDVERPASLRELARTLPGAEEGRIFFERLRQAAVPEGAAWDVVMRYSPLGFPGLERERFPYLVAAVVGELLRLGADRVAMREIDPAPVRGLVARLLRAPRATPGGVHLVVYGDATRFEHYQLALEAALELLDAS